MTYLELVKNSSVNHRPLLMTCATTGVSNDDSIIGIWVADENGNTHGLCCSGLTEEQLDKSFEFHKITKQIYDSTPQKSPEDFLKAIMALSQTNSLFTYNPAFLRKMLDRLCPDNFNQVPSTWYDIAKIHMWVSSGQIFTAEENNTVDTIMVYTNSYGRKPMGMLKILQQVYPGWLPDPAKTGPEGMLEGLRVYLQFLDTQTVRVAQPFSV